ncbi:MAG TPA: hypothetical protein VFE62_07355 [Gemmataceae bacterium]|nr:hypothetical protein [Gemmataceae bacterium]
MQAICRCGHAFTVHAVRFPHEIHCHACGYKFLVQEDGRTHECEGPPREFDVGCSCGQRFHIHSAHFPREVHCYACGQRFTVFDNGDVMRVNVPETLPPADPTAMVGDLRRIQPDVDAPVRVVDATAAAKKQKALADLKLIDLQWGIEQTQFLGISRALHAFSSLRGFALAGLIALVLAAACLASPYLLDSPPWLWIFIRVAWYALGIASLAFAYVVREMHEYGKAEANWQRQRVVVIAKAGLPLDLLPAQSE